MIDININTSENVTYSELVALIGAGELKVFKTYLITDYQTIYNQIGTGTVKTGATEPLIVKAISTTRLAPEVVSIVNPKDIIRYDVTDDETTVTNAPTKGRIIYREDENGNSAGYDWRAVLNYDGTNEFLTFGNPVTALNNISGYKIESGLTSQEFPNVIFKSPTYRNKDNYFLNAVFDGQVSENCNNKISGSTFNQNFEQNSSNVINNCINMLSVTSNKGCDLSTLNGVTLTNNSNCAIVEVNTDINGCVDMEINVVDIQTTPLITNCSGGGKGTGLDNCTIQGNGVNDFGSNIFLTKVENKSITETLYPELFDNVTCTIYGAENGNFYYEYRDNTNTLQIKQIS